MSTETAIAVESASISVVADSETIVAIADVSTATTVQATSGLTVINVTGSLNIVVHNQSVPATVWTIDHNLGQRPSVTVFDTNGDECLGDVDHPTANQTVINFSAAFAGTARLI